MTTAEQPKLTVDVLKKFAADPTTKSCVRACLLAELFAKTERERVDAYINPLFELFNFYVDSKWSDRVGPPGERITDIDKLYLTDLDSPEYKRFMEECDKEHRKHGFTGKPGYCPALIAEHLHIETENLLLDHAFESLSLGFDRSLLWGERREQLLKLVISMTVQASPREFTAEKLLRK
jgi:hypothetical protein